jgi:hypothetical protein
MKKNYAIFIFSLLLSSRMFAVGSTSKKSKQPPAKNSNVNNDTTFNIDDYLKDLDIDLDHSVSSQPASHSKHSGSAQSLAYDEDQSRVLQAEIEDSTNAITAAIVQGVASDGFMSLLERNATYTELSKYLSALLVTQQKQLADATYNFDVYLSVETGGFLSAQQRSALYQDARSSASKTVKGYVEDAVSAAMGVPKDGESYGKDIFYTVVGALSGATVVAIKKGTAGYVGDKLTQLMTKKKEKSSKEKDNEELDKQDDVLPAEKGSSASKKESISKTNKKELNKKELEENFLKKNPLESLQKSRERSNSVSEKSKDSFERVPKVIEQREVNKEIREAEKELKEAKEKKAELEGRE